MRKILPFLKPYKVAAIISISLMLLELMAELLQPWVMSKIIDEGIVKLDQSFVLTWGSIMVGCALLAFSAGIVASFYASHVSQGYAFEVRDRLYEKVQSFTFSNFNRFPTSSLIIRMTSDVTQIQNMIFMGLRIALRGPLLIILSVVMSLFINLRLALIFVVVVPILLMYLVVMVKKAGLLFGTVQVKLDHLNKVIQENLAGIRVVKVFLGRLHEIRRFNKSSEDLMDRTVKALRTIEFAIPLVLLIMNMSILVILWFGNLAAKSGGASVGEVVAIANYAAKITTVLSMLSMIIMSFSRARASSNRISEILEIEEELTNIQPGHPSSMIDQGNIVFNSVSFHYPDTDAPVLQHISFEARSGETVAILGATGSGKSSMFQLIPRLYEVTEGSIQIDDSDIRKIEFEHLRQHIGYVPQDALLFTGTVRENLLWGKEDATPNEIIEAAISAQIHETIMKLPKQYDTVVGQRGVNLSGGQKQRLSIARALIRKPKILLLDDSTSALDANTERLLLHALNCYKCTTLMITQKMSTAMNADKILLIDEGKLLAQGSHKYLLNANPLYQQIYMSQLGKEVMFNAQGNH